MTFPENSCYHLATMHCYCIEFQPDREHRRGFHTSQLLEYSLEPNADAGEERDAPPQKLSLAFSTADVVLRGWRLDRVADYVGENKLAAVRVLPKRYAELDPMSAFVASITITSVKTDA